MSILSLVNNEMRARVCGAVFLIVIFKLTCIGGICLCSAAEVACDQWFSKEVLQQYHFDKEQIRKMQISLAALGYDPEKIDGKMGEKTISALKRFCADFKNELAENFGDDLPATLSYYEAIAREDPDGEKEARLNPDHGETEKGVGTSPEFAENPISSNQTGEFEGSSGYVVSYRLAGADLESLKTGNVIIEPLQELQDLEYANKMLFENVLDQRIKEGLGKKDRELILAKARKQHRLDASKSITWRGWSCGCVLDDLSGVVYGFYPFWLAGDKQRLDFSVLTRIGYYALSFDDKGDIPETLHWDSARADFIKEARIYRTKVDLVIYKNDWEKWSQFTAERKLDIMDKATTNIVHLVNMRLTGLFPRIKPYISWASSSSRTMGDGVTLYFDGYPTDDDSMYFLSTFIEQLKSKLHTNGREHFLNMMLMLPMDDVSGVVQKLEDAEVVIENKKAKAVNFYLVFLGEPTSDNKKKLRQKIEDNFKGVARRNILRKIIPVITFAGHDEQQLRDDIIYFEDNFGGVGFWPLPISTDNGAEDAGKITGSAPEVVNNALTALYQKEDGKPVSSIFKFVCPNRWAFRIIWDIFTASLLVSMVLYFTVCEWRALLMKYFLYFILGVVLPWFLLSLFLLYYDPFWKKTAEGNTPLILVVLGIICYVLWQYFKKKKEAKLP